MTKRTIVNGLLLLFLFMTLSGCSVIELFYEHQETTITCEIPDQNVVCEVAPGTMPSSAEIQIMLIKARDVIRNFNVEVTASSYATAWNPFATPRNVKEGSGIIYKQTEAYIYILTNYHVIDPTDAPRVEYKITTFQNDQSEAVLIAYDATKDLAVLRIVNQGFTVGVADLSARENIPLQHHEFLLAVGNPKKATHMVTFGEFKAMTNISSVDFQVIASTVIIQAGSSGGALTDIAGHVVGINTWSSSNERGLNFSVPLEQILLFLDAKELR